MPHLVSRLRALCAAALVWAVATPALADLTGTFALAGGQQFLVEYRDADHFRLSLDGAGFELMRGGELYLGIRNGERYNIMHIGQMARQMQQLGGSNALAGLLGGDRDRLPSEARFEPLGRTETVAGITGEVYAVTTHSASGARTEEAVLASHPQLETMQAAVLDAAGQTLQLLGPGPAREHGRIIQQIREAGLGAVIRYGTEFRLVDLHDDTIPQARFELP